MTEALAASSEATDGVSPRDCVKIPTKTCDSSALPFGALFFETCDPAGTNFCKFQELGAFAGNEGEMGRSLASGRNDLCRRVDEISECT